MKIWVGYAHSTLEMDNAVFCTCCICIGTYDSHKVPMVNYLEEATVSSHFKRPAWMTTTNKGGWSIPGSKNRFAWQTRKNCSASRQRSRGYPRFYPCTRIYWVQQSRNKSCWKIVQHGLSTATGWSSATEALGQDTLISPPCSHFQWWRGHTKSSRP